jgi:hypothetical protein
MRSASVLRANSRGIAEAPATLLGLKTPIL